MKHILNSSALCLLLLLGFALPARAQYNAGVEGSVLDPGGAAIGHAKVALTNLETAVSKTAETSDSGFYRTASLLPGITSWLLRPRDSRRAVSKTLCHRRSRSADSMSRCRWATSRSRSR